MLMEPKGRAGKSSTKFLYDQICDGVVRDIKSGLYPAGSRLPSLDTLAESYKASRLTVLRAINKLKLRGLLYSVPAQGIYVSEPTVADDSVAKGHMIIALCSKIIDQFHIGPYHADMINGIQEALIPRHGHLTMLPLDQRTTDIHLRKRADAAIVIGDYDEKRIHSLLESGIPTLLVDNSLPDCPVDAITVDNRTAAALVTKHLLELGHQSFAVITGTGDGPSQDRLRSVRDTLSAGGVNPDQHLVVGAGNYTREGGYEAIREILSRKAHFTALICFNDETAAGALQYIHAETSLKVPDDLSVTGFDNINIAESTHPPLTTIHIDRRHIGRLAVEILADRLEQRDAAPVRILVQTRLVKRDSTGRPPPTTERAISTLTAHSASH